MLRRAARVWLRLDGSERLPSVAGIPKPGAAVRPSGVALVSPAVNRSACCSDAVRERNIALSGEGEFPRTIAETTFLMSPSYSVAVVNNGPQADIMTRHACQIPKSMARAIPHLGERECSGRTIARIGARVTVGAGRSP